MESGSAAVLAHRMDAQSIARATRVATSGATLASALGWHAEPVVRRGVADPGAELARLAAELEPDAVLVGSRGMRGSQALLNSVSDLVVHRSDCPVLVVATSPAEDLFTVAASGPVLVGWDGTEGAASALATARRLLPDRDVLALTAAPADLPPPPSPPPPATPSSAPGDERRPEVVAVPLHTPSLGHGRAVAQGLAGYAVDRHAALLVVGSRRRPAVSEVVLGSVAMATLHHGAVPVVVVPPQQAVTAD